MLDETAISSLLGFTVNEKEMGRDSRLYLFLGLYLSYCLLRISSLLHLLRKRYLLLAFTLRTSRSEEEDRKKSSRAGSLMDIGMRQRWNRAKKNRKMDKEEGGRRSGRRRKREEEED